MDKLTTQRLIALFLAGWLALSFPLLQLWLGSALALFAVWLVIIALLAISMECGEGE